MNLQEKLAREISRVTKILAHAEELPRESGGFLVTMCLTALDRACVAAGSDDISLVMLAIKQLEDFNE
jgi:hypothetical protein